MTVDLIKDIVNWCQDKGFADWKTLETLIEVLASKEKNNGLLQ